MDITVSISEIADVSAANSTKAKNSPPRMPPPTGPKLLNTLGSDTNISPGPCPNTSGLPPEKTKDTGTIIRPASRAIPVSNISI